MLPSLLRRFSFGRQGAGGVLILGMHRSGTSSLTGSLQQRGLRLGEVRTSNRHNPKGNREHGKVVALNDAVLAASGGAWDSPPAQIRWNRRLAGQRDRLIATLSRAPTARWGFKDPRTLLTLPFWEQGLPDHQVAGTFRHPLAVALSLQARQGMAIQLGLRLWREYNARLLERHLRKPFPLVCFDVSPADYAVAVHRVADSLGLTGQPVGALFFEESLRHRAGADVDGQILEDDLEMYDRLVSISEQAVDQQPASGSSLRAVRS